VNLAELPAAPALGVALLAGAASFLSPCVAPLVPGYLAFVTGSEAPGNAEARPLVLRRTGAFVLGFALVFTALGLAVATATQVLVDNRQLLEVLGGTMVTLMGLAMAWGKQLFPGTGPVVERLREPGSSVGAMAVGAVFGIAWTPCIGPALATILAIAATGQDPWWGAALLATYALGLGIPFLLAAAVLQRFLRASRALRAHTRRIQVGAGTVLVLMGVLVATGALGQLSVRLARIDAWL
jgi:cytochrome c-type biogenesis protein